MANFNDPFNQAMKIEQYLSVNEQIDNVKRTKFMLPEEKLYQIMTKTFNPFEEANFSKD
jgi:hypothetical protein